MHWALLRKGRQVRGNARSQLDAFLASKLATARAGELKEGFAQFWTLF